MGDGDGDLGDGPDDGQAVPQLAAAVLIVAGARPGLAAGYLGPPSAEHVATVTGSRPSAYPMTGKFAQVKRY
jgi:hypothetical protein